ncbi:cysteine desulfurase [Altererythrobacter atlanticus]|uniref:Cysteine desulfurase n=1 Tax=Croceibacterium atlanticum TaxID=1267766 RepID=A0A0F7KTB3_9SPHN|nr:cysteine desulfurase family protein [Croceibacterium atlanticum]AKH42035.1 Cysteine desulfurase [Croceibacterium atlanticum]MBB5733397.1 cysteine desulfurase [Croceibacterium atlanticum]
MIYLDYQATTPLAPEAREAMLRWLDGPDGTGFGNPHSSHRLGRQAEAAVEIARERVAALLPPGGTVIFTSGATESLNIALRGCEPALAGRPCAVSAIEHSAVFNTAQDIAGECHILPVDGDGLVDPQVALPEGLGILSVMQVNNEIGTIQPVADLYARARAQGALFICDAVQAAGKIPIAEADVIAISAHKFHGPKGIGALWLRDGVELRPLITGGGQEKGLRSGTLSPALCAGFGAAAELAARCMEEDAAHAAALWRRARELFSGWELNGSAEARYFGNLNIRRSGLDVARLMSDARQVCFSAGSACASESKKPSRILTALGLSPAEARGSIRLGFGRYTTMAELEEAAHLINIAASQQG